MRRYIIIIIDAVTFGRNSCAFRIRNTYESLVGKTIVYTRDILPYCISNDLHSIHLTGETVYYNIRTSRARLRHTVGCTVVRNTIYVATAPNITRFDIDARNKGLRFKTSPQTTMLILRTD